MGGCLVLVRVGCACHAVSGGLRSGAARVDVRLDKVPLLPSPAQFFLANCGGLSIGWVSCWT